MAVAGGESSDQTPVRGDAPADLGAAEPDRLTVDRRNLGKNEAGEVSKKCHGTEAVPPDSEVEKVTDGWFQSGGRSTVNKVAVAGVCGCSIVSIPTAKMEIPD